VVARLLERSEFPAAGTPATCAVSGGPDSSAMLALAVAHGLSVTAVHVDHALRPGSQHEASVVGRLAEAWGADFRSERVEVGDGPDLEARARDARRSVLGPTALYGHTADDQAETVLLRLLRGTGPNGLAAMRSETHPILRLRRCDTVALCEHLGVAPIEDPSNRDPRFSRNRVRHEVLPLLEDVAGRDVVPLLCRLADLAALDAEVIDTLGADLDPTDAAAVAAAPAPVAVAAWRRWWADETGSAHPPDHAATARMLRVAAGHDRACDVVDGWSLRRTEGRLRLEHAVRRMDPGPSEGRVGPR
jgi:tRNA(Ile)-lysidine synthase